MCRAPSSSPDVGDLQRESRRGAWFLAGQQRPCRQFHVAQEGAWGTRLELLGKEKRCWRQGSGETEGNQECGGGQRGRLLRVPVLLRGSR